MPRLAILAVCLMLSAPLAAAPDTVDVITLGHRSAEQVIPLLQPMLAPGGAITGTQNRIVVRTTPANLAELRKVVAALDAPPRQLLITVRQDVDAESSGQGASVAGRIGDERGAVVIGSRPGTSSGVDARVYSSGRASGGRDTQQVQVLEGNFALIGIGESRPLPATTVVRGPHGTTTIVGTSGRQETTTGFRVRPRLSGDVVTLEIAPQREVAGAAYGSVDVQQIETTVSGRLGEWIDLGGAGVDARESHSGVLARAGSERVERRRVQVRVDELH